LGLKLGDLSGVGRRTRGLIVLFLVLLPCALFAALISSIVISISVSAAAMKPLVVQSRPFSLVPAGRQTTPLLLAVTVIVIITTGSLPQPCGIRGLIQSLFLLTDHC
jgi:hypothetical protein